ncbi:MAG: LPS export ABC transporter periplasmic protein LptC [bacterium]
MGNLRSFLGLISIAALLGVGIILVEPDAPKQPEKKEQFTDNSIDYYIEDFRVTTMDANGQPERILQANQLKHFLDDETTELKHPQLTVRSENGQTWHVQSTSGWLSGDGELLLLNGDVDIRGEGSPEHRPMHLVTRDLRVQPEQNYAETDADVVIESEQNRVTATGMQAWLKHPARIKLLSNTRGKYVLN